MDIKGVARNIIPFTVKKKDDAKAKSALDADNEKEGNGQASGEEHKRRTLSAEEVAEAVKYLADLPGVKDHGLSVRSEQKDGITVVYVEDRDGKVVRRIPESELAQLATKREKKSGNLLNRAM